MKILVLGGSILDVNHHCVTTRNAAEANVPVYVAKETQFVLGGAANVVNQLTSLGCDVILLSVVGQDTNTEIMVNILKDRNIKHKLWLADNRHTTTKTRIFDRNEMIHRHDVESSEEISMEIQNQIEEFVSAQTDIDAVILSDYTTGVLPSRLCRSIIKYCNDNDIYTFVDPKYDECSKYTQCFCFKPNFMEASRLMLGNSEYEHLLTNLKEKVSCRELVITMGEKGILYGNTDLVCDTYKPKLVDVTGAGDIVMSLIVYFYLYTGNMRKACEIADKLARKSVETVGNYLLTREDIELWLDPMPMIVNVSENKEKLHEISHRIRGKNVVFTNGCFDILHSSHMKLLQFARQQGNILIVGLNTDESIRRIKVPGRPINTLSERSETLKQIGIIDYIFVFDEDTPYEILKTIQPSVLVKGGDYNPVNIHGGEFAKTISIFGYIDGTSTSDTIDRVKQTLKLSE
jgi:D-beta-D-heptose 7-phosphate kinase/D-beta-D-heptose 1-phosphate adenosyltransferase